MFTIISLMLSLSDNALTPTCLVQSWQGGSAHLSTGCHFLSCWQRAIWRVLSLVLLGIHHVVVQCQRYMC